MHIDIPAENAVTKDPIAAGLDDTKDDNSTEADEDEEEDAPQFDKHWLAALSHTSQEQNTQQPLEQPSELSESSENIDDDERGGLKVQHKPVDNIVVGHTAAQVTSAEAPKHVAPTSRTAAANSSTTNPPHVNVATSSSTQSLTDSKIPIPTGRSSLVSRMQPPLSKSTNGSDASLHVPGSAIPSPPHPIEISHQTVDSSNDGISLDLENDEIVSDVIPDKTGTGEARNSFYEVNDDYSDDFGAGDTDSGVCNE